MFDNVGEALWQPIGKALPFTPRKPASLPRFWIPEKLVAQGPQFDAAVLGNRTDGLVYLLGGEVVVRVSAYVSAKSRQRVFAAPRCDAVTSFSARTMGIG